MSFYKTKEYEAYRTDWESGASQYYRIPTHLDIEITTYCNLQCEFCPRTQLALKSKHMNFELYKRIIHEFAQKGGQSIKLCYLGEPLLYPYLVEAVAYAKQEGILDIRLSTNGTLMRYKYVYKLIKAGLTFINFSIDSAYNDVYAEIRKGGDLDNVVANLIELYSLKDVMGLELPRITIQCIVQEKNKKEIESGVFDKKYNALCDEIIYINLNEYYYPHALYEIETPDFKCKSPFRRMTVLVDGRVQICCGARLHSKIIGDLQSNTLSNLWQSNKFNEVRDKMRAGKSHEIDFCKYCPKRKHYLLSIEGFK